jgi:uncharacterized protein (DUF1697 family)
MSTYIALLRGINVGGSAIVKMADLKAAFVSMKFEKIDTYLQSGNVVFEAPDRDTGELSLVIKESLKKRFGFDIGVIAIPAKRFKKIAGSNPFLSPSSNIDHLYVTFLAETPERSVVDSLKMPVGKDEKFAVVGSEIFLYLPNGYGRTKINNNAFEKKLGNMATTRNWKTVQALLSMVH